MSVPESIPEDREQSFPCEVCNGNIKLSVTSGLWECDECGCLPGAKSVTKAEHEAAAGMGLEDAFMSHHEQPCDCAVCDDIAFRRSLRISENDLEQVKRLSYQMGRDSLKSELIDWLNNGFEYENSVMTVHAVRETLQRFTMQATAAGLNPHYEGCFSGESEEARDLRLKTGKLAE